ncbi:MAG TPA: hypothetical protein VFV28_09355 [Limnobacter sp.]|nr:hypothetical protein [Limnobacter sp.]
MMNMTRFLALFSVTLTGLPACAQQTSFHNEAFVYKNFLGEGKPEYRSNQSSIALRHTPEDRAEITHHLTIRPTLNLAFSRAITRSVQAGQVKVMKRKHIETRSFGEVQTLETEAYYSLNPAWEETSISEQDEVRLLMWMSEGNCLLAINKTVHESETCPAAIETDWVLLNQPEVETWILISNEKSEGWVRVGEQQVSEVSRSF